MATRRRGLTRSLILLLGLSAWSGPVSPAKAAPDPGGVVVAAVAPGGPGEAAGLQPGDVVRSWERSPHPPANPRAAQGEVVTVFHWLDLGVEQGLRGPVVLTGAREGEPQTWTVPPGHWGVTVRPVLPPAVVQAYEAGKRRMAEEPEAGLAAWEALARDADDAGAWARACWLYLEIAQIHVAARRWDAAHAAYDQAARVAEPRHWTARVEVWERRGVTLPHQQRFAEALAAYRTAGEICAAATGEETLRRARTWYGMGAMAWAQRDLEATEEYHRRGLAIRERWAPGSLDLAKSLNYLGAVAVSRDALDRAEDLFSRSVVIKQALVADSPDLARSLNNLGIVTWRRGDLAGAEERYVQALDIVERRAPGSREVAMGLTNLASVALERGDLARAESLYARAMDLWEARAPGSHEMAACLLNWGVVTWRRGEADQAETLYRRALAIHEQLDPEGLDAARIMINLGVVIRAGGDLNEAERWYRRALAIQEAQAHGGLGRAETQDNLGMVAVGRGHLDQAEAWYQQAAAIREKEAPGSLALADSWYNLGSVAFMRGDLPAAVTRYRQALAIQEVMAPGSTSEAESLHGLGTVAVRRNQVEEGVDFFRRAVEALEAQVGKLGGTQETQAGFRARHLDYYRDYLDALLTLGRPAEAFHVLERSRAQGLLSMLAERDLVFAGDLPPELERERRRLHTAYDRAQSRLADPARVQDAEAVETLQAELRDLRRQQAAVQERIRTAAPRLAALQYPRPLTLAQVRAGLDPGTVLLAYAVGASRTTCFIVGPRARDFRVVRLPLTRDGLRGKVQVFRQLIQLRSPQSAALARELSQALLAPAARALRKARRLVILPDGPLHLLPFAALTDPSARGRRPRWLGAALPLHTVVSATVSAEIRKTRRPRPAGPVVAFGAPVYAGPVPGRLGGVERLAELPATRREVEGLRALYPERLTAYLGPAATEERAKAMGSDAAILHFACHGLVDERFPLDSALALSIPETPPAGRDNGLLQAWEVFERVRLDADLVTLSACDTALGKEMGGEGMVGLSQAFQYAGARSLLVSLWPIADASTATFMEAFYGALRAGASKDVALQRAQAKLRDDSRTAAPYYWAPFVLIGDWQ